jgi:ferredoxin
MDNQPQETITGTRQVKQIGKYKVEVIREKCISAGSCVAIGQKFFNLMKNLRMYFQDGAADDMKLPLQKLSNYGNSGD